MAHLFSIPENVIIQHVFPYLHHNDLLRLRRVSQQTKALADAYLWTPVPGHQGKWQLNFDSSNDQTLEAFLQKGLPPPSRLYICNEDEKGPSEARSFFEDEHLEEFMRRYSKYVTKLSINKLFIPFTSAKELDFYESLINLKKLSCNEIVTVGGGPAQFERKTRWAEGSFLIRPTFKKLKSFQLNDTDCLDSMYNFINGVSNNLEKLSHPFQRERYEGENDDNVYGVGFNTTNLAPVKQLIERRGRMGSQSKLLYNFGHLMDHAPLELLQVFACCRDNGVLIKRLDACHLDACLLCDENGRIDRELVEDRVAWARAAEVIYQRKQFVGSVIHSLMGVNDAVFLVELPALKDLTNYKDIIETWPQRPVNGYPEWPNLKTMGIDVGPPRRDHLHFLEEGLKLPKLEELCLIYGREWEEMKLSTPRNLGSFCGNLTKLGLHGCPGDNRFFLGLWKDLPLLEHVTLYGCRKLTNKGFVGDGVGASGPAFLNLKKLKHLNISFYDNTPRITDAAFRYVFRHLKLTSFKLSSCTYSASRWITLAGIRDLLTGPFAETIVKLDLDRLNLQNVSKEQLKEVVSRFRSSKML